jgi:hypothetical protein
MSRLNSRRPVGSALVAALLALVDLSAQAATQSPFTYARADVFYDGLSGNYPDATWKEAVNAIGSSVVDLGDPSGSSSYAQARASFGSNGFSALSGSAGLSIWSDGFAIEGGTGPGDVTVSVTIDGTAQGDADMSYSLYVSANPFDLQTILDAVVANDQHTVVPGATEVLHTEVRNGVGPRNLTLTGTLHFSFGQPFYLAAVFGGDVAAACAVPLQCGSEDFYHSAIVGLTAPAGTKLLPDSGTAYLPAVPEPQTWALLLIGAGVMVARARRRA